MIRPKLQGAQSLRVTNNTTQPFWHVPVISPLSPATTPVMSLESARETRLYLQDNKHASVKSAFGRMFSPFLNSSATASIELRMYNHIGIGVLLDDPYYFITNPNLDDSFDGFIYQYKMSIALAMTVESHAQPSISPVVVRPHFGLASIDHLSGTTRATQSPATAQNPNRQYYTQGAFSILPCTTYYHIRSLASREQIRCDAEGEFVAGRHHSQDSPLLGFGFRIENQSREGTNTTVTLQNGIFSIQASYWDRSLRNSDPDQ